MLSAGINAQSKKPIKKQRTWYIKTFNKDYLDIPLDDRLKSLVKNGYFIQQVVPEPGKYGRYYTIIAYKNN
jgi:hypothetical protein